MLRAALKGAMLFGFGRAPGGPALYRYLTRSALGTQATHVDKLARVWPGYSQIWKERCGVCFEGEAIGVFEGGWTPLPFLLSYLLTGKGGWVANHEAKLHPRYTRKSLDAAVSIRFDGIDIPDVRREKLKALLDADATLTQIIEAVEGHIYEGCRPERLPLRNDSTGVVHSGGALEHLDKALLSKFAGECFRVLRANGIASHVFDHRDHLYHADKRYPFLNHLRYSESGYRLLYGHRLLYHSRILPDEVIEVFGQAGFELVALRRLILPSARYVEDPAEATNGLLGVSRKLLAPAYQSATDADLHTAAAHYLFRKPA